MQGTSREVGYDGSMVCPCCGNEVASVAREIRMGVPDAVLAIPDDQRERRVGAGHPSLLQLDMQHYYVRALLPVRLSDGHEFRFGVWLEVPEETCRRLWQDWDRPEYQRMRFAATLANRVPPWNGLILDAPCTAHVREQEELPYIESSSHPELARIMATPWSRQECEQMLDRVWGTSP
jgi:hypothetical protein